MSELIYLFQKISFSGDSADWQNLVNDLGNSMWHVARGVLYDDSLAEDAVQESFLQIRSLLIKNKENGVSKEVKELNFENDEMARAWVLKVTYFTAKNLMKSRLRKVRKERALDSDIAVDHEVNSEFDDDLILELTRQIHCLPEKIREPLRMKYFGGLTYQRISEILETQVSTVKSRVQKGVSILKGNLIKQSVIVAGLNFDTFIEKLEAASRSETFSVEQAKSCVDALSLNKQPAVSLGSALNASLQTTTLFGGVLIMLKSLPGIIILSSVLGLSTFAIFSSEVEKVENEVVSNKSINEALSQNKGDEVIVEDIHSTNNQNLKKSEIVEDAVAGDSGSGLENDTVLKRSVKDYFFKDAHATILIDDYQSLVKKAKSLPILEGFDLDIIDLNQKLLLEHLGFKSETEKLEKIIFKNLISAGFQLNQIGNEEKTIESLKFEFYLILNFGDEHKNLWDLMRTIGEPVKVGEVDAISIDIRGNSYYVVNENGMILLGNEKALFKRDEPMGGYADIKDISDINIHVNADEYFNFLNSSLDFKGNKNNKIIKVWCDAFIANISDLYLNLSVGKVNLSEVVKINYKGDKSGIGGYFQFKDGVNQKEVKFPEDCFEKLYFNFDLKRVYTNHLNLMKILRGGEVFDSELNITEMRIAPYEKMLETQFGYSIKTLFESGITGEVKGWVKKDGGTFKRFLWLGLGDQKIYDKIIDSYGGMLSKNGISIAHKDGGVLLSFDLPEILLSPNYGNVNSIKNSIFELNDKRANAFGVSDQRVLVKHGFELLPFFVQYFRGPDVFLVHRFNKRFEELNEEQLDKTGVQLVSTSSSIELELQSHVTFISTTLYNLAFDKKRALEREIYLSDSDVRQYLTRHENKKVMAKGRLKKRASSWSNMNFDRIEIPYGTFTFTIGEDFYLFQEYDMTGLWELYHSNGQVYFTANFENGVPIGRVEFFNDAGKKIKEIAYNAKGRNGLCYEWYDNGKLALECLYKDGEPVDLLKRWHQNGSVAEVQSLVEGNVWLKENYHYDGQLKLKVYQKGYSYVGLYQEWSKNGQMIVEGKYDDNGKKEGKWVGFYPSGSARFEVVYHKDEKSEFKCWYEDGKVEREGQIYNGLQVGLWKYYWPNGNLKISGKFDKGIEVEDWILFHSNEVEMMKVRKYDSQVVYPLLVKDLSGKVVINEKAPVGSLSSVTRIPWEIEAKLDLMSGYKHPSDGPFYLYKHGIKELTGANALDEFNKR